MVHPAGRRHRVHAASAGGVPCQPAPRTQQLVGLSIDEDALPYRKVSVQGTARTLYEPGADDEWRDLYRAIACRYVPADAAEAYLHSTVDQPRALIAVALPDGRVTTWRMPVENEHPTGIWARRYYVDGTHMANLAGRFQAVTPSDLVDPRFSARRRVCVPAGVRNPSLSPLLGVFAVGDFPGDRLPVVAPEDHGFHAVWLAS